MNVNLSDGALTLSGESVEIAGQARNDNGVAILPPQTFAPSRLIEIQMRMKDQSLATYYFNPLTSIAITGWVRSNGGNGQLTDKVSNDFTLMYLNPKEGFTNIDRVVLTIAGKEYDATNVTVKDNGDRSASIKFELKNETPREYPYTITALKLFAGDELFLEISKDKDLVSSEVYKSGEKMLACGSFSPPTVEIAGTKWCSTNLTGTPGQSAKTELCAKPEDYGSYFKFNDSYVFSSNSAWNTATSVSPGDPCQKLGSNYRTPTNAEHISLTNSNTNLSCRLNSVNGAFFGPGATSLSGNQSSVPAGMIFIPAAGCRVSSSGTFDDAGAYGYVWSSNPLSAANGYHLDFNYNGRIRPSNDNPRSFGFSVRCVQE